MLDDVFGGEGWSEPPSAGKDTTFNETSALRLYSIGIVVEGVNPKGPPDEILVSPVESMNIQTPGLIVTPKKEFRAGHPDEKGNTAKNTIKSQDFVRAKWICFGGSNRVTPPTVYPNESVILFRFSNHDEYYWTPLKHEPELRKQESATFAFSNIPHTKGWKDGKPIAYDKSTSYWFEVDAVKKLASFTTPKNNGEKAVYTIAINGQTGSLLLSDDKGSVITINTDSGISITTQGFLSLGGSKGVGIGGPVVTIGSSVRVAGPLDVAGDATVNGDIYTNTLYCDVLVTGNGPTGGKVEPEKPDKLGPDGKPDPDQYYKDNGLTPDPLRDWLLGISR